MIMKIKKRSGEFRGKNWCAAAREWDELKLESPKNTFYDNAIIVKEIIKGFFQGKYEISDFSDLVSQGVEDDYVTEKTGELRRHQLVRCLERYCKCEFRHPYIPSGQKELEIGDYLVSVKPDAIFDDGCSLEVVLYRAGKPTITQNGKKRDGSAAKCLELYFLLQYGRSLLKDGETKTVKASYYFLRKSTDRSSMTNAYWDPVYFGETGGNVVSIEDLYTGGKNTVTGLDAEYLKLLEEYTVGQECTEEDCEKCQWNASCHYVELPKRYELKTGSGKKGKIIPTDAQQKVIDFRRGVCRVNATAGSGKTECMTERGARMFEEGIKPSEVLFITFTDAGANEMKARIAKKCETRGLHVSGDDIQAMTFNTFAYRIVKDNFEDCGFTTKPMVVDDIRNSVIITQLLDENPVAGLDYLNYDVNSPNCLGALACAKKTFETIKETQYYDLDLLKDAASEKGFFRFVGSTGLSALLSLYEDYDKRLKEENLLQFADQEPLMLGFLDGHPDYLDELGYRHIIVDEFQDSNDTQLEIIRRLISTKCFESLMVVGDDSQSIYGFRNTTPENILHFFEKIGKVGEDLYLTENRRSTPEILELANKINALNKDRVDKDMIPVRESGKKPVVRGFHDKKTEYRYIAERIKDLIDSGYQPEDIAFIAFKKTELVALGAELTQAGIPWVMMSPLPYMENANVKAALSLAEAFYQPESDLLYFNYLVARYHGDIFQKKSMTELRLEVDEMKKTFMSIDQLEIPYQRVLFHKFLDALKEEDEIYQAFLDLVYANEDLQSELEYIRNFSIYGKNAGKKMEQKYQGVVLTTAHSSKGLEWKAVFNSISGYDSASLHTSGPKHQKKVEEARRLLFVSMTRARDLLYITGQYVAYGPKDDRTYNQFLREVFEAEDIPYCPVDPNEGLKAQERKKRAATRRSSREAGSHEMTDAQKAEYNRQVKGASQLSIFDALDSYLKNQAAHD